jgi:hypothetical protein
MVPVVLAGVTMTSLLRRLDRIEAPEELWRDNGRNILALDLSHGWATAVCLGVAVVALTLYVRDGVRDSAEAGE